MKPLDQSYSKSRRFKNQVKAVVTNPYNVIVLVAIVLLTYLIVLPLLDMISTTFTARAAGPASHRRHHGRRGQRLHCITGSGCWPATLSWNMLLKPLLNSLTDRRLRFRYAPSLLGSILAWLMVRTRSSLQAVLLAGSDHPLYDPLLV